MSQENGHHHDDQTPHPDKAAEGNVLKDPVCCIDVGKDSPHHIEQGEEKIYFCSEHCLTKFQKNPSAYPIKYEKIAKRDEPEVHTPGNETCRAGQLPTVMPPVHQFIVDLASHPPNKIEGDAVYLTGNKNVVLVALAKNVKHNKVIHSRTILLNFQVEDIPRVPSLKKIQTEKLGGGFHRIVAHYGFMEDPSLDTSISLARDQGLDLDPGTTSFYIGRENLVIAEPSAKMRWRTNLFIFMSRNEADATSFFNLPADQSIEVGVRLEI